MTPKAYEQLSLLERVLYHEIFDGQDQDTPRAVPYSLIQNVRHSGWICTIDGRMLNPDYFHLAPLTHHLDFEGSREDTPLKVIDDEIFDGQDQDAIASPSAIASKFGEYWIEHQYKTIKGKQYGPYIVKRWRDENGRKRSRYLGKAPTVDGDGSQQQKSTL